MGIFGTQFTRKETVRKVTVQKRERTVHVQFTDGTETVYRNITPRINDESVSFDTYQGTRVIESENIEIFH